MYVDGYQEAKYGLIYNSPWIIKLKKNYDSFSDQASRSTILNCPSVEERTWLLLAEVMIT